MKRSITLIVLFIVLCGSDVLAQTALPYVTGFDNTGEKAGWQQFRKGDAALSKWEYVSSGGFSAPACLYHDYPVGGTVPTDDWFVSPMFHLSSGGKIDSLRHAFAGFGVPHAGDTVALYLLEGDPDPALATAKTLLYDFRDARYANDGVWYLNTDIAIPAVSSHGYIAIRYYTTINWLDVKFDNLSISSAGTGISETTESKTRLFYPNPATDLLYLKQDAGIQEISVSDISGRELIRQPFARSINLAPLAPGTYVLRTILSSGVVIPEVLVKK